MSTNPSIINITLAAVSAGKKHVAQLRVPYTAADLRKILIDQFGNDNYRLMTGGQELILNDEKKFNEQKPLIEKSPRIYVLQRMKGGCITGDMVDIDTHKEIILKDLKDELQKIPTDLKSGVCLICMDQKPCYVQCHMTMCIECFADNFKHYHFKLKCSECNKTRPYELFFKSPEFISSLYQLDETAPMARNIDFQICLCGSMAINETMYSHQQCQECKRFLCFFCNEDWDGQKMKNQKYTCGYNCKWENYITYTLQPTAYNKKLLIPTHRICPKCKVCGAKDDACKYHECALCKHWFCFICLESKDDCVKKHKSEYNRPCVAIKKQDYSVFPRLFEKN
ncbi:unnamed protein product [Adineta steineri]|uniref:Uncharacterized protein n=1 Tax=Adineta steineri TaxID=433720 RepID=A0A818XF54_9BILA|nr:unnamed protein product [Adineta steineri]CAF3736617.1 unnamed protein product [Adineta steineri]